MRLVHPEHPGRCVRLAYCLNLHAGDDLASIRAGIEQVTLPLRDRLAEGAPFGVGAYLPAPVAARLAGDAGELAAFGAWLAGEGLVPFTFNAFPAARFHAEGLKRDVYAPAWDDPARVRFTLDVARCARALAAACPDAPARVSISTHPGGFGAWVEGPRTLHAYADGLADVAVGLFEAERAGERPVTLSLEAEPRASAGDGRELAEFLVVARLRAARRLREAHGLDAAESDRVAGRLLGTCLDTCHGAVEFEDPAESWRLATLDGANGKVQFSSALELRDPGADADGRAALLGLAEPVYLHQVTAGSDGRRSAADGRSRSLAEGRAAEGRPHEAAPADGPAPDEVDLRRGAGRAADARAGQVEDLPELAARLAAGGPEAEAWLAADAWRCHFHVPVDLARVGNLGTTRDHADRVLDAALADPDAWEAGELHLEIETYTWDVLPGPARGTGDLVDGLEREYAHVLARLAAAGWVRG